MIFSSASPIRIGIIIAIASFVIDQLTKQLIHLWASANPVFPKMTLTPFLDFIYIGNRGISYGLFSNMGEMGRWLFSSIAIGLMIFCIYLLKNARSVAQAIALGLIIGGGFGNLCDRLLLGYVIDFISLHAFGYYWYVFNIADISLTFGVGLFFLDEVRQKDYEP